jgi:hypothetical protein
LSVDARHFNDAPVAVTPETVIVPGSDGGDVSDEAADANVMGSATTAPATMTTPANNPARA